MADDGIYIDDGPALYGGGTCIPLPKPEDYEEPAKVREELVLPNIYKMDFPDYRLQNRLIRRTLHRSNNFEVCSFYNYLNYMGLPLFQVLYLEEQYRFLSEVLLHFSTGALGKKYAQYAGNCTPQKSRIPFLLEYCGYAEHLVPIYQT